MTKVQYHPLFDVRSVILDYYVDVRWSSSSLGACVSGGGSGIFVITLTHYVSVDEAPVSLESWF